MITRPSATAQAATAAAPHGATGIVHRLAQWQRLEPAQRGQLQPDAQAEMLFPLRIPNDFLARIDVDDHDDPLARQCLPDRRETHEVPGFSDDPVGDDPARRAPALLQKYAGRALLLASGTCAIHCRYCFRRHFDYNDAGSDPRRHAEALAAISADPSLHEVILSGGDPLSLSDRRLDGLIEKIVSIDHVRRLRLHTRTPVVQPERVTPALCETLARVPIPVTLVLHINHPREIDGPRATAARDAIAQLRATGATLLNQAVLLAGVNDDESTLVDLMESTFAQAVLPYYLHQLDRVRGAAHFEVTDSRARALHAALHRRLPGYLVPRLVREVAGAPGKTPLS